MKKKIVALKGKITLAIIGLLLSSVVGHSQTNNSGIYLSLADYQKEKLTYEIDCSKEKHKIKLNEFFNKPYITVIHDGKKYSHQKNDIYGFKDCNNKIFRFYKNKEYQIEESGNIIIYSLERNETQGKGFKLVKDYYFSTAADNVINTLSVENLKRAFPDNHKFHDLLDENLKDGDASAYDSFHKMYKVNHLYQASLKK
jgi:hypothetical protein